MIAYEVRPAGLAAQATRASKGSTAKSRREAVLAQAAEDDAEVTEERGKVTITAGVKKKAKR